MLKTKKSIKTKYANNSKKKKNFTNEIRKKRLRNL